MKGRTGLGSVRLKQVCLLDKIDLKLLLELWYKLLQLFSPGVCEVVDILLQELLELTRVEAPEKLLHLLETRREERELEGRRQLTRVRVTETNSFRIR